MRISTKSALVGFRAIFLLLAVILSVVDLTQAQVFTNKVVGQRNQEVIDSLKSSEYPYALPIWGAKATQAGYKLPYSAGLQPFFPYLCRQGDGQCKQQKGNEVHEGFHIDSFSNIHRIWANYFHAIAV